MPGLPICEVHTQRAIILGMLFFETDECVVLLNDLMAAADLGPLKALRTEQLVPEATITIVPREEVLRLEYRESSP